MSQTANADGNGARYRVELSPEGEIWVTRVDHPEVGPCYTSRGFARVLRITTWDLEDLTEELSVLGCPTGYDGLKLYPSWQLQAGRAVPGLPAILRILEQGAEDRWSWAQWLTSPHKCVMAHADSPHSQIQALDAEHEDEVLIAAINTAASWRGTAR